MNLAILYRQATDPGIAARNKLTGEFMSNAWLRCRELIAEAKHRYPIATERQFWEKYVAWADLGEPSTKTSAESSFERIRTRWFPLCTCS